jgi:hypothetical protein
MWQFGRMGGSLASLATLSLSSLSSPVVVASFIWVGRLALPSGSGLLALGGLWRWLASHWSRSFLSFFILLFPIWVGMSLSAQDISFPLIDVSLAICALFVAGLGGFLGFSLGSWLARLWPLWL